jgi:WD40 repeat protein
VPQTRLVSGETAHIAKLLEDTRRVMISFWIPIQASALHVYHSAFVFMPRCLLHETYESSSDAGSLCKLCTPRRSHWGFASTVLEGHQKRILHLAWSADSTTIASTSQDDTTRTWDAETGQQRDVLNHPFDLALGLVFLGDQARILLNKASGQAHSSPPEIKSMPLGRIISTLHGDHASKTTMKASLMSSDGARIGVWSGDSFKSQQTLRIWDAHTGRALFDLSEHSAPVYCCAFSPDSGMIATTASMRDNDLRLWDGKSGSLIRVSGHNNVISAINFSADSSRIASASRENVSVWDLSADGPPIAILVHSDLQVEAVAFTMNRGRLVSGTMDGNIRLWDVEASSTLCILRGHTNGVSFLAVSPDNTRLASGSQDGTIRIWDMPADADAWEADDPEAQQTALPFGEIAHVTLSSRLEYVAATSSNMLRISRNVGGETRSWVDDAPIHHARRISGVLTSPDGSLLVSVDGQAVARFWNPSTGELLVTLEPASRAHAVHAIRFSPNGDSFTMEQFDQSPTTWLAGKDYPSSSSTALPPQPVPGHRGMVLKPQPPDAGWLYYQNQDQTDRSNHLAEPARLFWVPPELRWGRDRVPSCIAATGSMAVIGGQGGTLTVMDCSKVVAP